MNEFSSARTILDRSKATREEWLALHDQHLGASDAGAIMGLSKYQTPLSTYVTKKGLQPHQDDNDFMKWGRLLEDLVRREFPTDYYQKEGKSVDVFECPFMYESTENPFMCVDPDGFVTIGSFGEGRRGLLEIKTTTRANAKYWKDDQVPDQYYAQCQHGMYVLDLSFTFIVCLMDKTLLWRTVPAKRVFMSEMVKLEKRFWNDFYLADEMPGPSGQDTDTDLLLELYPRAEDVTVDLGDLWNVERYLALKEEIAAKEKEQELAKQQIIQLMGVAHRAVAGEHKVSRVQFKKPVFDISLFKRDHPKLVEKYTGFTSVDYPRIS